MSVEHRGRLMADIMPVIVSCTRLSRKSLASPCNPSLTRTGGPLQPRQAWTPKASVAGPDKGGPLSPPWGSDYHGDHSLCRMPHCMTVSIVTDFLQGVVETPMAASFPP